MTLPLSVIPLLAFCSHMTFAENPPPGIKSAARFRDHARTAVAPIHRPTGAGNASPHISPAHSGIIMSALANRDYVKMNGLGNEIVVVDLRHDALPITAEEARAAARHEPYDQLMALYPARDGSDALVRIYNNDGSEAGACGNGMRCVASLVGAETGKREMHFETAAGLVSCWRDAADMFTVDMGLPHWRWDEIPLAKEFPDTRAIELSYGPPEAPILSSPSVVSMGNPHAIFWVDDPRGYDLARIGPQLEHHPLFPERANIT